jgi:isoquinoline 1-oxidoreductase
MNVQRYIEEFPEPERYELYEGPRYRFRLTRREFVQVLGAGVLISVAAPAAFAQRSRDRDNAPLAERLHIAADGTITVLTGKVEVGQGSRTQLTQAAAEELRVPVDRIRLVMADSAVVPDDGGTAGSRTTPSTVPTVRKACAAARQLMLDTAANKFQLDAPSLEVRDGQVQGLGDDRTFGYASLVAGEHEGVLQREAPPGVAVIAVSEWRVMGTSTPRIGSREIVMGVHQYPSDITRPGMLHGVVLRPPSYTAELAEIDLAPARELPNVTAIRDGNFVGFAAPNSFAARQARDAAASTARWNTGSHPSSDELYDHLRSHASDRRSRRDEKGSPDEALDSAHRTLRETYHIAYIHHAPMEPRAAVAEWNDGELTVWTGTQQPSRVRDDLARTFRIPSERVRLIVPDTGGGFGGKHSGEAAVEAARLAREAGKPVSVKWSREEEFTWAYFRPAGVIDLSGALDTEGRLTAWEHVNFNSGASAIATPYDVPNICTEYKSCDQPLRSGSYRALASTANAFARECFMDELAHAAGIDPLEFRLRHLTHERVRGVLLAATERFGWKSAWKRHDTPQRVGVGLGCATEKGSYVATCAEVHVDPDAGTYRVVKACTAFECGAVQNPANLKAQVEGAVNQGIGAVLHEEIHFRDGRILNPRFSQYRVPRFRDVPELETVLLDRKDLPSVGGSETPIIAIAPAIANALFNAVQARIRSLPLRDDRYRAV